MAILVSRQRSPTEPGPAMAAARRDIRAAAQIMAMQSSAAWVARYAGKVKAYATRHELLPQLCRLPLPPGDLAEVGAFAGAMMKFMRPCLREREYRAFDNLEDHPEWTERTSKVSGGRAHSRVPHDVIAHVGSFEVTVPAFVQSDRACLAFVYIDCQLFEAVKTVLDNLHDRLALRAVVVFNDWYNFPNWQAHSRRALEELINRTGAIFTPIAITLREHAVAFRYEGISSGR